jgi:hypothetical protein
MNNSVSKGDKGCVRNPIKKVHKISDKCLIVIDNSLVERLRIGEHETWFEQEQTENGDGIIMKIKRYSFADEEN